MEEAPSTPKRTRLTRDQRRDILILRDIGKTYSEIALYLHIIERAVQYTCNTQQATPKKNPGRPLILLKDQIDDIESFIYGSKKARRMLYKELGQYFDMHPDRIK